MNHSALTISCVISNLVVLSARSFGAIADDFDWVNIGRRFDFHDNAGVGVHVVVSIEQNQRRASAVWEEMQKWMSEKPTPNHVVLQVRSDA